MSTRSMLAVPPISPCSSSGRCCAPALLSAALCATSACASGCEGGGDRPNAADGVGGDSRLDATYAGLWQGENSLGLPVAFRVSDSGELLGFFADFRLKGCGRLLPLGATGAASLYGDRFEVLLGELPIGTTIDGRFTDSRTAEGTFASANSISADLCNGTLVLGSQLVFIELFESGTWHAQKCEDCKPTCAHQGDGECDEPGRGAGLCFPGRAC